MYVPKAHDPGVTGSSPGPGTMRALAALSVGFSLIVSVPAQADATNLYVNCVSHPAGLQSAIDRVPAGSTLVIYGTCVGTFTVSKNLTLRGLPVEAAPVPTLDGYWRGTVLTVAAGHLTVTGLRIWHGVGMYGGGIHVANRTNDYTTTLTLNASRVARNRASAGGGIFQGGGRSTLNDSLVVNNHAATGGGIYVFTSMTLNRSKVSGNGASGAGGGLYDDFNSFVQLEDSLVSWNRAENEGGGILNGDLAQLELSGHTVIYRNTATTGGGIFNTAGDVYSGDPAWTGKVARNIPDDCVNGSEAGTFFITCGDA
jgi:hypothetical protein